jgi:hypothetical protein
MLASGTIASVESVTVIVKDAKSWEKSALAKQPSSKGTANHLRMREFTCKGFARHAQAHHDSKE